MSRRVAHIAAFVLALLLLTAAGEQAARNFENFAGVDFYHLWGVGHASRSVPGDPYAATDGYSQQLNAEAARTPSVRLRQANEWRRRIEPTGTPFFYAVFGLLPADYDVAYGLFFAASFVALVLAIFALARMRGLPAWAGLSIAAVVALTFNPFVQDMAHGNVTTLQLGVIVAAIAVTWWRLDERWPALGVAYLPVLAAFAMFKPNAVLIVAALAAHYAWTRGARRSLIGAGLSALALAAAWAAGAAFFGDAAVWAHWREYTHGMNGGTLLYGLDQENFSLAMLMAERSGALGVYGYGGVLGAAMVLFFVAAMTQAGKRPEVFGRVLREVARDPGLVASIGILITFAVTPLMWSYYRMFALVPIAWLSLRERRWDAATTGALLAYVLMSRPLVLALLEHDAGALVRLCAFIGWLPLVPAVCARLAAMALRTPPWGTSRAMA